MHPKVLMLESVLSEYKLSALHRSLETVWSATEVLILLSAFYVTSCSNFISQKLIFLSNSSFFLLKQIFVLMIAFYVAWILMGTVAWVSHLGHRAPILSSFLPSHGYPSNIPAEDLFQFLKWNVPLAFVFVLPHSLLRPARLYRFFGTSGRIVYNFISAICLHFFLYSFIPLQTPVMMTLPIPESLHTALSVSCLTFAMITFLLDSSTWSLLGVSQLLQWQSTLPEPGMDAITWMGMTVWKKGGALAFVLFTGLSILPKELTLGDCITRGVAAVYLRQRSHAFRKWVEHIESIHLFTWILRAALLFIACASVSSNQMRIFIVSGAAFLALTLRVFESS